MRLAQFVRTSGLLLMLGVAGFGGGCGSESVAPPVSAEEDARIKSDMKSAHEQLKKEMPDGGGPDADIRNRMKAAHGGH